MTALPITQELEQFANDPNVTPEERARRRRWLAAVRAACDLANRWGYNDNAALRVGIFTRAATAGPDELGDERIQLGLMLDDLCDVLGVPLDGEAKESAEC